MRHKRTIKSSKCNTISNHMDKETQGTQSVNLNIEIGLRFPHRWPNWAQQHQCVLSRYVAGLNPSPSELLIDDFATCVLPSKSSEALYSTKESHNGGWKFLWQKILMMPTENLHPLVEKKTFGHQSRSYSQIRWTKEQRNNRVHPSRYLACSGRLIRYYVVWYTI